MSNTAEIQCPRSISEEDRARAQIYQLLGALLVDPPSNELLKGLASLQGDETPLGSACKNLAALAERTNHMTPSESLTTCLLASVVENCFPTQVTTSPAS